MRLSPRSNRLWLIASLAGISALGALALLAQTTPVPATGSGSALGQVPVGAILPYVGSLDTLPAGWLPCDGRVVDDPDSPFHGREVPNIMDQRFVMGVASADDLHTTGGTNELAMDGQHTHRGSATNRVDQVSGSPRYLDSSGNRGFRHTHDLQISASSTHNHGGDNRPQFYGTYFIIRVK